MAKLRGKIRAKAALGMDVGAKIAVGRREKIK
jgi:hypothetical protein